MATRPLIGITSSLAEDETKKLLQLKNLYVEAIIIGGGLPFILPIFQEKGLIEDALRRIDGLLLAGGVDVDPLIFHQEPHPRMGRIDPYRDYFELEAFLRILSLKKPCLGICRGCQIINIALGGSLFQDLEGEVKGSLLMHNQKAPSWYPTHSIDIEKGSHLAEIYPSKTAKVNSFHHQAIHRVAKDAKATAYAFDGVIEAIEYQKEPFVMGVQWHPETMWEKDKNSLDLFQYFIAKVLEG